MKIETLRREARASAKWRGHDMKKFRQHKGYWKGPTRYYSECKVCDAYVEVNSHPIANEIDIAGDAVAVNCKREEKP